MAEKKLAINKKESPLPKEITFHYIKANDFKTAFATGIFGGITVNGKLNIDFYTERIAIPDSQTIEVINRTTLGEPIIDKTVSKKGVIREVQVGVLMDIEAAKLLAKWINETLEKLQPPTKKI